MYRFRVYSTCGLFWFSWIACGCLHRFCLLSRSGYYRRNCLGLTGSHFVLNYALTKSVNFGSPHWGGKGRVSSIYFV
jgi:hypothetical protein